MDTWQEWQKAYRFGVVLIFPPDPVLSLVNGLRERYDPKSRAWCDAHISLTVPVPRPITAKEVQQLESVTAHWTPLRIRYGPPKVYPAHPGVTLGVEPEADLRRLCVDLEAAPPFLGAGARAWPFSPHMTIAEFVDWEESGRIMQELSHRDLVGEFTCSFLSLAVPDEAFRFTEQHRLCLCGGQAG
jgi:2'-5' RNA ligase